MVKEILEYLNRKASSTLIFVFVIFWIICHSQGFATMFFTDQNLIFQKYGLLKNEYLQRYFFGNFCDFDFWARTLLPFFLTWFYIWILPKLLINRAYKKQINDKIDREIIKEEAQQKLIKKQKETTKEEVAAAKEQVKLVKENKKIEDETPEMTWEKAYDDFTKIDGYNIALAQLREVMYSHQGFIRREWISSNSLMICDTNGLINITGNTGLITDKGKFFLKLFASDIT